MSKFFIRPLIYLFAATFFLSSGLRAQAIAPSLGYYLPSANFDPNIPTPASSLGFEVGEWHASHDQLVAYMRLLDQASDRISMRVYGRSHEGRPMVCLTITHPDNHARLDAIRAERSRLSDPASSGDLNISQLPAVNYMGYSIHGNEPSGSNASMLVAYYLAAARTEEVDQLLRNTIILFDPSFNPDGMQRFSSWANSRRSMNLVSDPSTDEYNEPWPKGRYNHYFFDLNRDWLVVQQPESEGRVAIFQEWHPNVLTDHHEMGSNNTFFFQPGVSTRVNPITPAKNQELTAKIATYHAASLSEKRIQFFTGENFDDFYYGKGSTYPDAQGCIGILFEQASSRGSVQETEHGLLTFPYTIRNQVITSLSTLKAVREMRVELNEYLRDFYTSSLADGRRSDIKGYVFSQSGGDLPARSFFQMLQKHRIQVKNLSKDVKIGDKNFQRNAACFVPCEQPQYRLIRGIFERQLQFQDSIFYDISAWTLPDAFGLDWAPVTAREWDNSAVGDLVSGPLQSRSSAAITQPAYAYVLGAENYELPKALHQLLKKNIRVKVAMQPFEADGKTHPEGSIVVMAEGQPLSEQALLELMNSYTSNFEVTPVNNGLTSKGPDLGSENFRTLRQPKVLLLTGEGVNPSDAGEVWHLLDTRYGMSVSSVDIARLGSLKLSKYNVMVMADGQFNGLSVEKVREFAQGGGTIIAMGSALNWLKNNNLVALEFKSTAPAPTGRRPYGALDDDKGGLRMPGCIFEAEFDLTHPLCFGYSRKKMPIFLSEGIFVEPTKNAYATPVLLTKNPLLAGYANSAQKAIMGGSAGAVVCGLGAGKVIGFPGSPNFRAFWYGTNRLFANALFFGNLISSDAVERK
ncbi:MAG: zinc carboxypeptidase [Saprospiraceae bacterium]|nr:zinc carboxypeptidase [Saprospiraceae bacterium]